MNNYYVAGAWNCLCDVCGFKFKSTQLKKRWDGMMVCDQDFETRHPQDFLRGHKEETATAWSRPEAEDTFVAVTYLES